MSAIICKTNQAPLDTLHQIIQELKDLQLKLRYANISYLPKSETIQQLEKSSPPKPRHAKITYPEGPVSSNVKIFQKYIDQSLKQQNLSL